MRKISLVFILALLTSCGSKNEIQAIPSSDTLSSEEQAKLVESSAYDKSIEVGNFVVYEVPKIISISSQKKCSYFIQTKVYISSLDIPSDTVELTISKTERSSQRNSRQCPSTFGVNETNLKSYSLKTLLSTFKKREAEATDPNELCRSINKCISASKVKSKKGNYKGVLSTYTVIDFELSTGEKFRKSSWVATENLFLNNFSYKIKNIQKSEIVDFKRALDFSMTNTN